MSAACTLNYQTKAGTSFRGALANVLGEDAVSPPFSQPDTLSKTSLGLTGTAQLPVTSASMIPRLSKADVSSLFSEIQRIVAYPGIISRILLGVLLAGRRKYGRRKNARLAISSASIGGLSLEIFLIAR